MKNSEMRYPVSGTSALQPEFGKPRANATIIAFPGQEASTKRISLPAVSNRERSPRRPATLWGQLLESEIVSSLRYGTAKGVSYDRVKPWQAIAAGIAFSGASFAAIMLGF